jgi:hypothetical protein
MFPLLFGIYGLAALEFVDLHRFLIYGLLFEIQSNKSRTQTKTSGDQTHPENQDLKAWVGDIACMPSNMWFLLFSWFSPSPLLFSTRNSIEHALEEDAHIPLESLLISARNSIENALEAEGRPTSIRIRIAFY